MNRWVLKEERERGGGRGERMVFEYLVVYVYRVLFWVLVMINRLTD